MACGPDLSLSIDHLDFGAGLLFAGLRITVPAGQKLALIGPSGVGKSTLLRILAGVERTFTGSATVGGQAAHLAPVPGMVFQEARLLPWATVVDNLLAFAPGLSGSEIEELLTSVGLQGRGGDFPHQLQGILHFQMRQCALAGQEFRQDIQARIGYAHASPRQQCRGCAMMMGSCGRFGSGRG